LKKIARTRSLTLSKLIATINASRDHNNLSSAIRLFVLYSFQNKDGRTDEVVDAGAATVSA
jgi:predicted DNA-binding ribbon-helix-helix protein